MSTIIVGAGNKTRIVMDFLLSEGRSEEIVGIVDRDSKRLGDSLAGRPVIGTLESVLMSGAGELHQFCICLGEQFFDDRARITKELTNQGAKFVSIVSRHAHVSFTARVEPGAILFPNAYIGAGARVGSCSTLWTGALVEHDCLIGENVEIAPRAVLAGRSRICEASFIGVSSTVLPDVSVGPNALVGAGSVVIHDVPPYTVVAGNPARVLRDSRQ